jgi:hypothetical protein
VASRSAELGDESASTVRRPSTMPRADNAAALLLAQGDTAVIPLNTPARLPCSSIVPHSCRACADRKGMFLI